MDRTEQDNGVLAVRTEHGSCHRSLRDIAPFAPNLLQFDPSVPHHCVNPAKRQLVGLLADRHNDHDGMTSERAIFIVIFRPCDVEKDKAVCAARRHLLNFGGPGFQPLVDVLQ